MADSAESEGAGPPSFCARLLAKSGLFFEPIQLDFEAPNLAVQALRITPRVHRLRSPLAVKQRSRQLPDSPLPLGYLRRVVPPCSWAISCTVFTPRMASSPTLALKTDPYTFLLPTLIVLSLPDDS